MNTGVRWKLMETNPFAHLQQVGVPERQPAYFSKAEFQTLLNAIREQWLRDLVVFAAMTGMRRGEITNLRWSDVDVQRKLISIQSNPTFKTKQGKKRVVPMSDLVFNQLSAKTSRATCEYVFHIGGRKINDDHAGKKLRAYVDEAGLNPKLHFHSLRHTFASWLVQDGVSLYEVQKLLGHSNIAITQVYSHLQPETLHSTVNRISINSN
jgi:integrase